MYIYDYYTSHNISHVLFSYTHTHTHAHTHMCVTCTHTCDIMYIRTYIHVHTDCIMEPAICTAILKELEEYHF